MNEYFLLGSKIMAYENLVPQFTIMDWKQMFYTQHL